MNQSNAVNYTLYIITVSEGTFCIENNRSVAQIGVISKTDILTAKQHISDFVNYEDVQDVMGGNFLTGLKKFGKNLWHHLKPKLHAAYEFGKKALPYVSSALNAARFVAPLLAAGDGAYAGGARVGGQLVGGCRNCYGRGCAQCGQSHGYGGARVGGSTVGGKMICREHLRQRLENI